MKRFYIIAIMSVVALISACSPGTLVVPTLTITPIPVTNSTPNPTSTPTLTLTFTNTPTITPTSTPSFLFTCEGNDQDVDNAPKQGFFDIIKGNILYNVDSQLVVILYLKDNPPDPFLVNTSADFKDSWAIENLWGVFIDSDGNPNTGAQINNNGFGMTYPPGFDYSFALKNKRKPGSTPIYVSFQEYFKPEVDKSTGGNAFQIQSEGDFLFDPLNKSITLSVILPGLTEKSKFYFFAQCSNPTCDISGWKGDTIFNVICSNPNSIPISTSTP